MDAVSTCDHVSEPGAPSGHRRIMVGMVKSITLSIFVVFRYTGVAYDSLLTLIASDKITTAGIHVACNIGTAPSIDDSTSGCNIGIGFTR